ncbi:amidohydrolase [Polaromonas sp. JS666]|uniref:amidohydrolase family protein n=1 Tax=Polaromonas sp. (strain JS666 / ATCC BAA-500) TaxID=296591 RepID=UPI00088018EF|nr:amidohydrolase family protein [Polaromonas sp. JS666]SDM99803.1 Predicted metal-dependent hydrolase, TIM-barrel fold [Polaromonas sp. JS666]
MRHAAIAPVAPGWDSHVHVFDAQAPVAAGHYRPVHRPLADIEELAQAYGFGHLVLVQPSVYGTDNSVLLGALRAGRGRHRGVVVLPPSVDDATLADMHALGVRGVRFNLVSPVGDSLKAAQGGAAERFQALAPRLRALGWHVQWYASPEDLPAIAALHAAHPVPAVLDHLAGMHAGIGPGHPAWRALEQLTAQDAWVKLSGWYRLGAQAPYEALYDVVRRMAALFGRRLVWGSDWPHTAFAPDALPAYASTWEPVSRALTTVQKQCAREQAPAALYG